MGARGAVLVSGDQALEEAAPRVSAVDCTAAGDAFAGALATALARGASLGEAVGRGVRAGALATTTVGAYPSLPTAAMLDDLRVDPRATGRL
jgi:ribokinase